jgi:hypothetical protein
VTNDEKKYEEAMLWLMGAEDAHTQLSNYINGLHEQITTLKGELADMKKVIMQFAALSNVARDLVGRFNGAAHEVDGEPEEASV